MEYVLILFVYNRPFHAASTLNAIRREGFRKLKIFIDGPRTESDFRQQKSILKLIQNIDWADYEVYMRDENLGLARSISLGIEESLQDNDGVIVLEDDCLPKHGFREFMLKALETYRDDHRIRSICAYTYPCIEPGDLSSDFYFSKRFCPWGWGTWKNRWEDFTLNLENLVSSAKEKKIDIASIGKDIAAYCQNDQFLKMKADIWSINWIMCHLISDSLCLYPKFSLIENIGFDGSGVHSSRTDVFDDDDRANDTSIDISALNKDLAIRPDVMANQNIIRFLEQNSKMCMLLNQKDEINDNLEHFETEYRTNRKYAGKNF